MAKSARQIAQIQKIIAISKKLIQELSTEKPSKFFEKKAKPNGKKRIRRSGKELQEFRKMLKAERAKGVPVAELAKKHGVSVVYIYTL